MEKILYLWYYEERGRKTISGAVLAETWDDAIKKTKEYLKYQFEDINGKMNLIT